MPEDFSGFYTVEFYGNKGWEVWGKYTSWSEAINMAESLGNEWQKRITTPEVPKNELVENLEQIQEEMDRGLMTPQEYAERIILAVTAAI